MDLVLPLAVTAGSEGQGTVLALWPSGPESDMGD